MSGKLIWHFRPFVDLSVAEVYEALAARQEVFVIEQNCVFLDADGLDCRAWHLLGRVDGMLIAYARLLPPGVKYEEASIGRVLTTKSGRGRNFGRALMAEAISRMEELFRAQPIRIGAQLHLQRFYESFGFKAASEVYMEDGIPHIEMLRH
ncbi:MAG: GNAT family N-acetyltransferase [Bryobacterales bacterium]|nr:GNAT family N-acetyltransferase [Bryobacterales bacterium]